MYICRAPESSIKCMPILIWTPDMADMDTDGAGYGPTNYSELMELKPQLATG